LGRTGIVQCRKTAYSYRIASTGLVEISFEGRDCAVGPIASSCFADGDKIQNGEGEKEVKGHEYYSYREFQKVGLKRIVRESSSVLETEEAARERTVGTDHKAEQSI
jgi:hypothetical protein